MNAQQAYIEVLLDNAAQETVDDGAVSLTTEMKLADEGYMLSGLQRAVERRIQNKEY